MAVRSVISPFLIKPIYKEREWFNLSGFSKVLFFIYPIPWFTQLITLLRVDTSFSALMIDTTNHIKIICSMPISIILIVWKIFEKNHLLPDYFNPKDSCSKLNLDFINLDRAFDAVNHTFQHNTFVVRGMPNTDVILCPTKVEISHVSAIACLQKHLNNRKDTI